MSSFGAQTQYGNEVVKQQIRRWKRRGSIDHGDACLVHDYVDKSRGIIMTAPREDSSTASYASIRKQMSEED